jgi:hypothetical protein
MEKNKNEKQGYECEACGATSDKPKSCCGKPMKKRSPAAVK